ncbi:hypothetical protein K4F52_003231 [Lecanicillium sp. MT-2017a]|nr:hypothetical protein K4F52_003231 [Lecanicillium sp. MT-2017a]
MSKRTTFTTTTALPPRMTRQSAVSFLHDHGGLISLNPLVTEYSRIAAPTHAAADEEQCAWYSVTDRISFVPGVKAASGSVSYTTAFFDLAAGVQTHSYAPLGVDLRSRWTICGNEPGEKPQPVELGLAAAPRSGLYLREDTDLRCSFAMAAFVKKTLRKSHATMVEALSARGEEAAAAAAAAAREDRGRGPHAHVAPLAGDYPWNAPARQTAEKPSTTRLDHNSAFGVGGGDDASSQQAPTFVEYGRPRHLQGGYSPFGGHAGRVELAVGGGGGDQTTTRSAELP